MSTSLVPDVRVLLVIGSKLLGHFKVRRDYYFMVSASKMSSCIGDHLVLRVLSLDTIIVNTEYSIVL